ncbi:uncharacterized protein G2W53_026435 [Senna tora]|uniref:Uncharacterized protein n=1 Tax=Senna tora TaxID=362788 RepID=A0A834TFQ2_9FABA|nr:uncharacterized protein G2W53_026435 [Senna tora]
MLQLESSRHGRSVDHVLTYSRGQIAVGSQKPSRITMQKTCCTNERNTSVRVVFANRSGFDAPIGVVMAWVERGLCLNIFRTTNHCRISETCLNYEAKDFLRNGFDAPIGVVKEWKERGSCLNIFWMTNRGRISDTFTNYETKHLLRIGFDDGIGVVMAWEERGSCLNILRMRNCCRISETFTNYEAKDLLRKSVDHLLTYFEREIDVGSQKPSRITRQNTCCAIVMAREEPGSCLNIFRMTNHGRISETFTNYEAKDWLRKVVLMLQLESSWLGRSVDHLLTYSGREIVVGSQKPSRITRQKTCCAYE